MASGNPTAKYSILSIRTYQFSSHFLLFPESSATLPYGYARLNIICRPLRNRIFCQSKILVTDIRCSLGGAGYGLRERAVCKEFGLYRLIQTSISWGALQQWLAD